MGLIDNMVIFKAEKKSRKNIHIYSYIRSCSIVVLVKIDMISVVYKVANCVHGIELLPNYASVSYDKQLQQKIILHHKFKVKATLSCKISWHISCFSITTPPRVLTMLEIQLLFLGYEINAKQYLFGSKFVLPKNGEEDYITMPEKHHNFQQFYN